MRIIAGLYKNQRLKAPKSQLTRPSAEQFREALFNICQTYIEGAQFLDLFAGSGAIGIEAVSRGAVHSTFVDKSRESISCIKENLSKLKAEAICEVIQGDVLSTLAKLQKRELTFDIIFADPPYGDSTTEKLLQAIDKGHLLKPEGTFFLETGAGEKFTNLELTALKYVKTRIMGSAALHQYVNIS